MLSAEVRSARRSSCSKATDLRPVGEVEPEGDGIGGSEGGAGLQLSRFRIQGARPMRGCLRLSDRDKSFSFILVHLM